MTEENAFLRAIQESPADDTHRLVYADWLDERGDPRANYLRTELQLARLPADSPEAPALRERLWRAWAEVDPAWLAVMTQPRMLRANPTPFAAAWSGTDLGRYRPVNSTYGWWPYESLPPLPAEHFRGEFQWLAPAPADPAEGERLEQFASEAAGRGLSLPESFQRFMANPESGDAIRSWWHGIRSVTDCYFMPPEEIIPDPAGGGFHVPFYSDSQSVVLWDLYLHPAGGHCVIARLPDYFEPFDEPEEDADEEERYDGPRAWFAAPSFEAFIYRIWAENELWYIAHADFWRGQGRTVPPLTPALQAYLSHYERQAAPG